MARIMLIDDEVNIIKTLSSILEDEGYEVLAGKTGGRRSASLRGTSRTWPSWISGFRILTVWIS